MSQRRSIFAVLTTAGIVAALTALAPAATAEPEASSSTAGAGPVRVAAGLATVRAGQALTTPTAVLDTAAEAGPVAKAATFNVTYTGFTPQARAAFQRAVNIWATKINSPVPITVDARFTPLGAGVLGSAGPGALWRDFPGAPKANTWYVDAVANKRRGSQLDPSADIQANFSSNFSNWHYGAGNAPSGKYDFTSVVLHELGHGLGFLGGGNVNGANGSVRLGGFLTAYDRVTERSAGKKMSTYPDPSAALKTALTSNDVVIDTPKIRTANGGAPARLYAPASWQPGSSYSHFNEATYPPGNVNSLMTPQLSSGETIRAPGNLTLAVFTAVGW